MTRRTPGEAVRDVLDDRGLNVTEGARALRVTRVALSRLVNGQAALSADMAVRVAKAFGLDFEELMTWQFEADVEAARQRARVINVPRYRRAS